MYVLVQLISRLYSSLIFYTSLLIINFDNVALNEFVYILTVKK